MFYTEKTVLSEFQITSQMFRCIFTVSRWCVYFKMVSFIKWNKLLSLWPTRGIWRLWWSAHFKQCSIFGWRRRPYRWSIIVSIYRSQSRAHFINIKSLHIKSFHVCYVCVSKCIAYVIKSSPLVMIINWFYKCRMCNALVRFCLLCIWLGAFNCDSKIDCFPAFYRYTHLICTCTCTCTHSLSDYFISSLWYNFRMVTKSFSLNFCIYIGIRQHNGEITIKWYKWTIGDKCGHWTRFNNTNQYQSLTKQRQLSKNK